MAAAAIPVGLGIASAAAGAAASRSQNKAIQATQRANQQGAAAAQRSAIDATNLQRNQLAKQTSLERSKAAAEYARMRGRLRVVQSDSGFGGTADDIERQLDFDAALNDRILVDNFGSNLRRIDQGLAAETTRIDSQLNNVVASLQSQRQSPFLTAFSGGVSGLGTGLAIGGGLKDIGAIS